MFQCARLKCSLIMCMMYNGLLSTQPCLPRQMDLENCSFGILIMTLRYVGIGEAQLVIYKKLEHLLQWYLKFSPKIIKIS